MDYPKEWDDLPKRERKKKIKELKRQKEEKANRLKKFRNYGLGLLALILVVAGYIQITKKSPEEIEFEQDIEETSLEGKVEEFPIEGRDHVSADAEVVYKTNPPTSGSHFAQAKEWGIYDEAIDDKAAVHSLEHGGIWISYKDLNEEDVKMLEELGKSNSQSVLVSPRSANEDNIAVASWGRMMRLGSVDRALIQKYIDTYKNQSPEKLAR